MTGKWTGAIINLVIMPTFRVLIGSFSRLILMSKKNLLLALRKNQKGLETMALQISLSLPQSTFPSFYFLNVTHNIILFPKLVKDRLWFTKLKHNLAGVIIELKINKKKFRGFYN